MRFSLGKDLWVLIFAGTLLVAGSAIHLATMRQDAPTVDEPVYLAAGAGYWQTGRIEFNLEHPPLAKWIQGIPLLFLHPTSPFEARPAPLKPEFEIGATFLFQNRVPADLIVWMGRLPSLALWIILGAALFATARRWGGSTAGLIALTLYTFDPTVLAHGHLATNDIMLTASLFLAAVFFERMIRQPTMTTILLSTFFIVLPPFMKFSGLLMGPVFACTLLLSSISWKQKSFVLLYAGGWFLLLTLLLTGGDPRIIIDGIQWQAGHNSYGHESNLFGQWSWDGWWYYFPMAFLFKTPLATIILTIASALAAIQQRHTRDTDPQTNAHRAIYRILPATFAITSLFVNLDIGIRYLLPIFPFLFMGIGVILARQISRMREMTRRWGVEFTSILLGILVMNTLLSYPHYLSFFNLIAGGRENGHRVLNDSNLDWGQDLKRLRGSLDANPPAEPIYLDFFGARDAAEYYLNDHLFISRHLPANTPSSEGTYIVSAFYRWRPQYAWLDSVQPFRTIGSSILLYDLSKLPFPSRMLP